MKYGSALLALPALTLALPGYNKEPEKRQLLTVVGNLLDDVEALVGSVASMIDPDNYRPEPGYDFIAPGPGDSRGPCPGLNLLANHGYLPRDGHVSFSQVLLAVNRGFNMGADLATVLCIYAILFDGDFVSETWYLGQSPDGVGGLNRHSTVEVDVSPNREDYYLACGDNHHLSSNRFKQNVKFAAQSSSKDFGYDAMAQQYSANARFSQQYNPWVYYFPFPSIVSVVAFNFYPEYFSNGTYGSGGVANYESISSIVGAKLNKQTGDFEYVPERWPEQGWYRRATGYGAAEALTDGFTTIYPADPVLMPVAEIGTPNLNASTILCNLYQGLNSMIPIALAGDAQTIEAALTWAVSKLVNVGLDGTTLGCPSSAISANLLYPNATTAGGPLGPSLKEVKNAGNNVYYKTYFTQAPTTQQC